MIRIKKKFPHFFGPDLFFLFSSKNVFLYSDSRSEKIKKNVLRLKPGQIQ